MGGTMEDDTEESKFTAFVQTMNECFDLEGKMSSFKEYAIEHPVVTLFSVIALGMCSVPVVCFFAFAFGSTVLAFTGFLFIEGTVLTIATLILGAVLCFVGLLSIGFSSFLVFTYISLRFAQNMVQKAWSKLPVNQTGECDSTTK